MKQLLLILFIAASSYSNAQNYECLQYGVKRYFTNSYGYLRAMRVDSNFSSSDSIVCHPFRTPRCFAPGVGGMLSILDSTGGSWLGKETTQRSDGTFFCKTIWNDTVFIKTQALIGDTWIFYNDTTERRYMAEVIGINTKIILGDTDNIKKIQITAYEDSGIVYSDPANNFQIIISQNHGFYQVCDLYTFPYHAPGHVYSPGLDYYLDKVCSLSTPAKPDFQNAIFTLTTPFAYPTKYDLYSIFEPDALEYKISDKSHPGTSPYQYLFYTISTRFTVAGGDECNYSGWLATQSYTPPYVPGYTYPYTSETVTGSFIVNNDQFTDSAFMPEEYRQKDILYYFPSDTSFCRNARKYKIEPSALDGNFWANVFDTVSQSKTYKVGMGLLESHWYKPATNERIDTTLIYNKKSGLRCRKYFDPVSIPVVNSLHSNQIHIFPNPASESITLTSDVIAPFTATIFNAAGQKMKTIHSINGSAKTDVSDLPSGMYQIVISTNNGENQHQKIVIIH